MGSCHPERPLEKKAKWMVKRENLLKPAGEGAYGQSMGTGF